MSCYTGFFNVRRGWQSLNTGPRFYLRLIRRTGWLCIYTSRITDGRPFKPKKLLVPFLYPGVPVVLTPFRGLVPLGRRNLVPILTLAHTLWGGWLFGFFAQYCQSGTIITTRPFSLPCKCLQGSENGRVVTIAVWYCTLHN